MQKNFVQLLIEQREGAFMREKGRTTLYGFIDESASHDKAIEIGRNIVKNNEGKRFELKEERGAIGGQIVIAYAFSIHELPYKQYTIIYG